MTVIMYDSIEAGAAPTHAQAVAGYVDGIWPSYGPLLSRFNTRAHCLSITVRGGVADCLDVEKGDATVAQAAPWVSSMLHRGVWRPCVYADASTMPAVERALSHLPRSSYRLWVASYPGGGAGVPAGFDAHQYINHGPHGEHYDMTVCLDSFFPAPPPKPPKPSRKPRKPAVHPKVAAAGVAGTLATAIQALLSAHGIGALHLTPAETSAVTTMITVLAGYLKSA